VTLSKAVQQARRQAREQSRAQKIAQVQACVQDGWPLREIYRTYNTGASFVKRWFPDYTGMPAQESGSLSMAIQRRKSK
jgi:transposase